MKTIGRDFGDVARKVYATASGVLPNGKPVAVNSDGTVSVVAGVDQALGSEVLFNDSNSFYICSAFDPDNNKIVIAYRDDRGGASNGKAVVGTISGTSVSFGTAVVFKATTAITYIDICYDTNSNKFVIAYDDPGNSSYGTAIVATVSGTNISFGSAVVFEAGTPINTSATFDSNSNKVVISYGDYTNSSYGTSIVGTVSGTNISFGTAVVFASAGSTYTNSTFDSSNNKIVISYVDTGNNQRGTAIVGTVSGTSISFGSETAYGNILATAFQRSLYNSDSNSTLITHSSQSSPYATTAVVGTVSGTSISFGASVVFPRTTSASNSSEVIGIAYNPDLKQYVAMQDEYFGGVSRGTLQIITISGTTPVMGAAIVFSPDRVDNTGSAITYDTAANNLLISWGDRGNSYKGTSVIFQSASTTLTAENYIGMSSGGVEYDEGAASLGSAVVFEAAETVFISSTFDSANNRVVICYVDGGNSNYATAIVGTVSGTSISFGTPVVFLAARIFYNGVAFDSNSNKIVIAYRVASNGYGTAIVGTVSGTTISFGTSAVFQSATSSHAGVTFDSNSNKVVIAYNNNNQYGTAVVATVSGTNISFGTPVVYKSAYAAGGNDGSLFPVFDSNSNKVVIAYSDASNGNDGYAVVGTVSGTAISFGTAVTWGVESFYVSATFDSNSNKVVVAYRDADDSNKGKAIVGTVSGTTISFGSAVVFNAGATTNLRTVFDSNTNKVVITYQDSGNSDKSTLVEGEVSGTSISFGSELVFDAASSAYFASAFDSNSNKVVISYHNASDYGTAIVYKSGFDNTVRGQVASGGAALVNTKGAINTNQNALTAGQSYFVQTDGTITTTAGTPSVFAGTAVSATKLIVKG